MQHGSCTLFASVRALKKYKNGNTRNTYVLYAGVSSIGMLYVDVCFSVEFFPVAGDNSLVPEKAIFADALMRAVASIILIHIDESIAFAHLRGTGRNIFTAISIDGI